MDGEGVPAERRNSRPGNVPNLPMRELLGLEAWTGSSALPAGATVLSAGPIEMLKRDLPSVPSHCLSLIFCCLLTAFH